MGGLYKFAPRTSREAIDRELAHKVQPVMREGGVVFGLDHRIPNGTPLELYRYYVARARDSGPRAGSQTGLGANGVLTPALKRAEWVTFFAPHRALAGSFCQEERRLRLTDSRPPAAPHRSPNGSWIALGMPVGSSYDNKAREEGRVLEIPQDGATGC